MTPKLAWMVAILQRPRKPDARYGWLPEGRAAPKGRGGRNVSRFQVLLASSVKSGTRSRTVSEQDVHRRNLDDRSVHAFAIKPAPSARRYAASGLDRSAQPSKPEDRAADALLRLLGVLTDSVRQVRVLVFSPCRLRAAPIASSGVWDCSGLSLHRRRSLPGRPRARCFPGKLQSLSEQRTDPESFGRVRTLPSLQLCAGGL
jgi:hypothetical protein